MPKSSIMKENTDRKPAPDMGDQDNTRIGMLRQPETPYERRQLSKHDVGWRRILRNFTPSWFSVTMGTGIVSILLNTLPHNAPWLYWISVVIFALNVLLFAAGCVISLLRYTLYPEIFKAMILHPVQSMFLGTFPMGFATIINMFCFVCVVAAASGAIVADVLPDPQHALWTIIVSYVLWGIGIPLAMMVMVIYFHRLTVYKLPPKEVIVSVFLPMGPLGQGGFGIMKLGASAQVVFPKTHILEGSAGSTFYVMGFLTALILWAFGLVWLFSASASIARCKEISLQHRLLGRELPSRFFEVLGTILSLFVVILWIVVFVGTAKGAISGKLFYAPCLAHLSDRHSEQKDATKAA
ncbi:putative C4-dicarboxylate transporter/malic acid transport protein [Thermoascus aurantiacus ATCC 26904]